jgi:hypothetical protein
MKNEVHDFIKLKMDDGGKTGKKQIYFTSFEIYAMPTTSKVRSLN